MKRTQKLTVIVEQWDNRTYLSSQINSHFEPYLFNFGGKANFNPDIRLKKPYQFSCDVTLESESQEENDGAVNNKASLGSITCSDKSVLAELSLTKKNYEDLLSHFINTFSNTGMLYINFELSSPQNSPDEFWKTWMNGKSHNMHAEVKSINVEMHYRKYKLNWIRRLFE